MIKKKKAGDSLPQRWAPEIQNIADIVTFLGDHGN